MSRTSINLDLARLAALMYKYVLRRSAYRQCASLHHIKTGWKPRSSGREFLVFSGHIKFYVLCSNQICERF